MNNQKEDNTNDNSIVTEILETVILDDLQEYFDSEPCGNKCDEQSKYQ